MINRDHMCYWDEQGSLRGLCKLISLEQILIILPLLFLLCIRSHYFKVNRKGGNGNIFHFKVIDFIVLGSKITIDGDCSYEIKGHLLLGKKAMTNLDSTLKSRD